VAETNVFADMIEVIGREASAVVKVSEQGGRGGGDNNA
jgi:hypothetical protein